MTKYGRRLPYYSAKFKKQLVREVIAGGFSASTVAKRHGVGVASMYRWLDDLGEEINDKFELDQFEEPMPQSPKKKSPKKEQEIDQLKIEELEEALRLEKLKGEAYLQMIKIAEERFKISIKKKFGTKQSDK